MLLFKKMQYFYHLFENTRIKVKHCYDLKWFLRRYCLLSKFYAFACAEQLHGSRSLRRTDHDFVFSSLLALCNTFK